MYFPAKTRSGVLPPTTKKYVGIKESSKKIKKDNLLAVEKKENNTTKNLNITPLLTFFLPLNIKYISQNLRNKKKIFTLEKHNFKTLTPKTIKTKAILPLTPKNTRFKPPNSKINKKNENIKIKNKSSNLPPIKKIDSRRIVPACKIKPLNIPTIKRSLLRGPLNKILPLLRGNKNPVNLGTTQEPGLAKSKSFHPKTSKFFP